MIRATRKNVIIGTLLTMLILFLIALIADYAKIPLTARINGIETQPLVLVVLVLLIIVGIATGAFKKRDWGSYDHPPSMKQLAWLRNRGYSGRMPTSSREAHKIISDIKSGGDGNFERDDYDRSRRSKFR